MLPPLLFLIAAIACTSTAIPSLRRASTLSNSSTPDLTTADIPPQFLEDAAFVGKTAHRILISDPRLSYSLYIPPEHYNPDPKNASYTLPKLPLVVSVHGTKRDLTQANKNLSEFAEETPCAVLVPLFPAAITSSYDVDSYKKLNAGSLRSDLALLSMLDEIAHRWPGVETEKFFLMGFSGGGQFVHRFLYLYPERLAAASVGAPGHITFLNYTQNWPNGIADVPSLFDGRAVNKTAIAEVPIQMIVGGADNTPYGNAEFWEWVQETLGDQEDLMPMEKGRLDMLKELRDLWEADGIKATFEVVEGVEHESDGVRGNVLRWLKPLIQGGY